MSNSKKYLHTNKIIGNWQSKRLIIDRLDGSKALYSGKMNISPDIEKKVTWKQGFKYQFISLQLMEAGSLTTKNETYQFSQQYVLNLYDDRCDVFFNNKSLFFGINRFSETQRIDHLCKLDRYFGQITFVNESSFFLSVNVLGPKKNYYLKVLYKR